MKRPRLPQFLAGLLLASVIPSGPASAAGADVVGGHLRFHDREIEPGLLISVDFTSGASDTTPGGIGFDGHGIVYDSEVANGVKLLEWRTKVLCVNAVGDVATVVTEITRNNSEHPDFQAMTHAVFFVRDGDNADVPDAVGQLVLRDPSDATLQGWCATAFPGGNPIEGGNVVVKDGAE